ncbi:MarR family winged helix-turn-helix transcriptional regulator [Pseudoduganella plicata]|uniref:HTH-type transcriptional regulator SarZ n=1 Tax=Pseudoduganella plicata TaxID=321984 RepID=A0A4P7BH63_9BURK|nr:MarR family transcriptional regulator [Pseudoduganella plicata]QBQ38146.1 MarR family transcriptional regulator [Pseudoduganella plicata]GGZ02524.1 MarR family transcriptional regulator [Pseudoduganella plicata]
MQVFEELQDGQFGYLISQARNALFAALDQEMAPLDLTASQFVVVIGAMRQRARTVTEFGRLAGIEPGPMSRLLDRMEAKGIIRKVRDQADGRQVNVELTEKGIALYPQINAGLRKVYGQLMHGFSEQEAEAFKHTLEKILLNARQ